MIMKINPSFKCCAPLGMVVHTVEIARIPLLRCQPTGKLLHSSQGMAKPY